MKNTFKGYMIVKMEEPVTINSCITKEESFEVIDKYIEEGVDPNLILIFLPDTGFTANRLVLKEELDD